MTDRDRSPHHQQIIKDFLRLLEEKNIDDWIKLWADDSVQEMPYSPSNFPSQIDGTAIYRHY